MRIMCEIKLDRKGDSLTADGDAIAMQIDDEFLPAVGQSIFISGDEGESEYTITSVNVWHEEDMPMRRGEHAMTGTTTGMSDATATG